MAGYGNLLEEALESWEYTRAGIIEELENIPEEEFDFRPTPESRSVTELAQHIIESAQMMSGELTRPDGDFRRQSFEKFIAEYAPQLREQREKARLIELLRSTHVEGDRGFRAVGELFMLQFIRRFDGQQGTRLAWLYHGIEHENYHRGQLALYARMLGHVPALTQKIG